MHVCYQASYFFERTVQLGRQEQQQHWEELGNYQQQRRNTDSGKKKKDGDNGVDDDPTTGDTTTLPQAKLCKKISSKQIFLWVVVRGGKSYEGLGLKEGGMAFGVRAQ